MTMTNNTYHCGFDDYDNSHHYCHSGVQIIFILCFSFFFLLIPFLQYNVTMSHEPVRNLQQFSFHPLLSVFSNNTNMTSPKKNNIIVIIDLGVCFCFCCFVQYFSTYITLYNNPIVTQTVFTHLVLRTQTKKK